MAQSQTVALPNFLSAGNYFIAVKADSLSTVSESNEGNNYERDPGDHNYQPHAPALRHDC